MKVFQIGFSKCGTSSIHDRFQDLGLSSVHNKSGEIAKQLHKNKKSKKPILENIDQYQCYTDMYYIDDEIEIEGYNFYPEIMDQVDGALFILNTRNMDNWINSCRKHPRLFERLKSVHFVDDDTLLEILKLRWKKHHEDVVKHIPSEKLLVFDIERDNAAEIDKFLGLDSKLPMKLKKANVSPGQTFALLNTITPTWIRGAIPKPIKSWVSRVTRQMP